MGFKTMKMGWDICSSPPWVPFYPYTMFQNPISRPSCQKWRKSMITQKVLVTQSSNIVYCNQHSQKPICADIQAFLNNFSLLKLISFFHFCQGKLRKQAKISHFVDSDWEKCIEIAWVVHIWGLRCAKSNATGFESLWSVVPEKSQFQAKISHFVDFDWEKCIEMAWVAHI